MEAFGAYLKEHREKKNIRLEEIASITKIHLHNLQLLEAGRFGQLPPEPFIRGFITAYAKYIGMDPKDAVARYLALSGKQAVATEVAADLEVEEAEGAQNVPPPVMLAPPTSPIGRTPPAANPDVLVNRSPLSKKKVAIGLAASLVVALGVGLVMVGKRRSLSHLPTLSATAETPEEKTPSEPVVVAPQKPPVVVAAAPETPAPVAAAPTPQENRDVASPPKPAAAPAPTTAAAPATPDTTPPAVEAKAAHELLIEGKERTWIKVVIDGEQPVEYFLPEGEKKSYSAKQKIKVVLGNSTGAKVTHNGQLHPGVKFQGTIRSYIFPPEARFPQDIPSRRATSSAVVEKAPEAAPTPPAETHE